MRFDLKRLFVEGSAPVGSEFSLDLSQRDFPGYRVLKPVTGRWSAEAQYGRVLLTLDAAAVVDAECSRCLSPLEQTFYVEREWKIRRPDLDDPDFELPLDEKGCMDVDELIYEEIVLEVPPVLLCSPDCLGLCPICGKKKASGCLCQPTDSSAPVDARLAILQKLLN